MDTPVTEERPWGRYTILLERDAYKVKELVVSPGQRLSYQRHAQRSEHWHIVAGSGEATLDDHIHPLSPGISIDVARHQKHRVTNTGTVDLVFIEVQRGTYFGEDDIERFDDDYGRA